MSDPRVDVVLHIGADKTGTTSLQQMLRHNRAALLERGVLYPRSPGRVRHVELGLYARSDARLVEHRDWLRGDFPAPPVFRRRLRRRLVREVAVSGAPRVLLSDEALFRMKSDAIIRLRELLEAVALGVRVVVYLRRQDDHLATYYQQAVKVGEVLPMREWVREHSFRNMYDYRLRLRAWRDALCPERLVVRPFETSSFADRSLFQDFLDAAGIDLRESELAEADMRNERLSAEAVEMLRILNLHRIERGAAPWEISNRSHIRLLRAASPGPQLTLPDAELDRFMDQWTEPNRWVATELLGEPELFREPRRIADSTSAQLLDPARLNVFLSLLGLTDDDRSAIREVAEREASRIR